MQFLIHFFSPHYKHPLSRPQDQKRLIPYHERFYMLLNDFLFYLVLFWLPMSCIMMAIMLPDIDFKSLYFGFHYRTSQANIVEKQKVDYYEDGIQLYSYKYRFKIDNKDYAGISYDTNRVFKKDSTYNAQYQALAPSVSRLEGMRLSPIPFWGFLFILMFVLVGIGLFLYIIKQCSFELLFKEYGIFAPCTIQDIKLVKAKHSEDHDSYELKIVFTTLENKEVELIRNVSIEAKDHVRSSGKIQYLPWNHKEVFI